MTDIGYGAALLGGVATVFSPCAALLLPAFFAYAFTSATTLIGRTLWFYAGLLTTLMPLGALSGGLGALLVEHRARFVAVMAVVVIVSGVLQMLAVPLPGLPRRGAADSASPVAIYTLGLAYGVAGTCSGPILGSVLAVAALGGDALYGAMVLLAYATGMVVPVFVLALLWTRFDLASKPWLRPRPVTWGPVTTTRGNLISGALFVVVGVVLLVTEGTAALTGVLQVESQQRLESQILGLGARVPDLAVIAVCVVLVAAAALLLRRGGRRPQSHGT